MHSDKYDVIGTFLVGFFIVSVILGITGAVAFNAHENNVKSRQIAVTCVEHGGTFRQDQGTMTCDGIKK